MKKFLLAGALAASLIVPSAAMADAPDGSVILNDSATANENASALGVQSSAIKQNGQFVSGKDVNGADWQNQTAEPGKRAALVQTELGH